MQTRTRNYLVATAIGLAVAVWMLTGLFSGRSDSAALPTATPGAETPLTVEVATLRGSEIERRITAQGQVRPERAATLRAETAGQVVEVAVESGEAVETGDLLVRLAMDDRSARLREAEALLRQRQREYEAAQRLGEEGFQSRVRQDEAAAALATARAAVERIELDIQRTEIRAPFPGVIDDRLVDQGDYAAPQTAVITLVDNDPLIAQAYLSQHHFDAVRSGAEARVRLISGEQRSGRLTAVAPRADAASRMFRVEVEVPNPDGIPANTSAEIVIPVETVRAHRLSPSLLALDSEGTLGVKTVGPDNRVAFRPIEIVRSDAEGIWVTGLPETARVITAGGGFAAPDETVAPVEAPTPPAAS